MQVPSNLLVLASLLVALLTAGCAPNLSDVQNPQGFANVDAYGRPATNELMLAAIRMGASAKHWGIVSEAPGVVVAQVSSGGHHASVRIDYNERGWVITHQASSPGLKYDPDYNGRQVIHHRYNMWVRHLNRAIENALVQLQTPAPAFMVPAPVAPAPPVQAPAPAAPVQPAVPAPAQPSAP
jgi:hypothetical protein